ncbi:TonB-dependent siderophore receptor [Sphingomonas sp. Leaf4]|uniref:TonB-dependent siderophore receptor n=1 Tax=Sphingomonas sp. Leaf4 TaxID=2876553 RepID=UPI001E577DA2|nr:TonB-dependent receptor [Sphingomonas sp. Leaf4]
MKTLFARGVPHLAALVATAPVMASLPYAPAQAQATRITVPALPLAEALQRIETATGATVVYDGTAIGDSMSMPVIDATTALDAVRQATGRLAVSVRADETGRIVVTGAGDIVVTARRDEAETGLLVRATTTSSRTGQALRDQPRNTQVISSRLLEEQQAQTMTDALRNAGVTVNTATVQGGVGYSVRGFGAGGLVNGLPAAGSDGSGIAGTTQPIANIERIEVLKGPDALLAGIESLGGTINIVTKKPSAETRLAMAAETGSYGQGRLTIDANRAIDADGTVSARVIGAASTADRNYGGYRGNKDFLFAPGLRFKNATTDLIVSASVGEQKFGPTPFVPLNPRTNRPFDVTTTQPLFRRKDQGIEINTTQFAADMTQKVTDWLTVVARGQHQKTYVNVQQYSPFGVFPSGDGRMAISNSRSAQGLNSDAVDVYARFKVATGPLDHLLVAGYTYVDNDTTAFSSSTSTVLTYNFLTATQPPRDFAPINRTDSISSSTQNGYYAQYLMKAWKLSLLAGVRHNVVDTASQFLVWRETASNHSVATTPNFGLVFDVTDDIALFGSLAYGYAPTSSIGRDRRKLPDIKSRNAEAGVKITLFGDRMLINASYFRLRQSNLIITDPTDFLFPIAVPGLQSTGIDLNLSGEILRGWTMQGSYTRTDYKYLTPSDFGNVVVAQPKDNYSLYTSYRHSFDTALSGGVGAGLFGRSSASVDMTGSYYVPPARQVDLNVFLKSGAIDVNLGLRNLFDRRNYNITYSSTYLPVAEPRNWRLTVGYRFR